MRLLLLPLILLATATGASAQSVAELRAQLQETRAMIAQGEAAGMDPEVIRSLRESMNEVEQSIREMEADEGSAQATAPAPENAAPLTASFPIRANKLDGDPACTGFTLQNYRQRGLEGGNDVQLKTMCAQAFEYYNMYLNAIRQGYAEADANRTYDAHAGAALNASSFYANNRGG
jgi:hypothetical protein